MKRNSFIEFDIYFDAFRVENIFCHANNFGMISNWKIEVTYNDDTPILDFDNFKVFLETKEPIDNLWAIKFYDSSNSESINELEYVKFILGKSVDYPCAIFILTKDTSQYKYFLELPNLNSAFIHSHTDCINQFSRKKSEYFKRNGQLEDYLVFYKDYDYNYKNDLSIYEESIPGHYHRSDTYCFYSYWQMYYSTEIYYQLIPEFLWDNFEDCIENIVLKNGLRKITLYGNIFDYQLPNSRLNQWAFRRKLGIDSIAHEVCSFLERMKVTNLPVLITKRSCEKGDTRVVRFLNNSNELIPESDAVKMEITELLNDGKTIIFKEIVKL